MNLINEELELRKFGYAVGGVFLLIATINWKFEGEMFPYLLTIGAILLAFGFLHPKSLSLAYKLWMALAYLLNAVVTRVILATIFYLLLSPIALISRAFGKKFLDLSFKSKGETYWQKRPKEEVNSIENQF